MPSNSGNYIFLNNFSIGLEDIFDSISSLGDEYFMYDKNLPPFNIRKVDGETHQLELAMPGYSKDNIKVSLEGNFLTIIATPDDIDPEDDDVVFYSGVDDGDVYIKFVIPKYLQIKNAVIYNGVLVINFKDITKNRKEGVIKIKKGKKKDTPIMPSFKPEDNLPEPEDDDELTATPKAAEEMKVVKVNEDIENKPTVEISLPEIIPQVISVEITDGTEEISLEVKDATIEVSDTAELELVKTSNEKSDVVVAIEPEVKAELEDKGVDVSEVVSEAINQEDKAPDVPEFFEDVEIKTVTVETADSDVAPIVDVVTPNVVSQILKVEIVETQETTAKIKVTDTSEGVSETAELIPVVTPEGQPDVVVAIEPEVKAELEAKNVDVAGTLEIAFDTIDAKVETVVEVDQQKLNEASEVYAKIKQQETENASQKEIE